MPSLFLPCPEMHVDFHTIIYNSESILSQLEKSNQYQNHEVVTALEGRELRFTQYET